MHTLAGLSDEVLGLILSWSSLEVATLWMAGDTSFNKRIARSCSSVRTSPSLKYTTLKRWPRMLSDLRSLHTLHIQVYSFSEAYEKIIEKLKTLSATIEELHLFFDRASSVPGAEWPTRASVRICWSMAEIFPRLRKLSMVHEKPSQQSTKSISDDSLAIFPATLEELNWSVLTPSVFSFQALPRGLQSLSMDLPGNLHRSFGAAQLATLPPNLTRLIGIRAKDEAELHALPRTLTYGNFSWPTCPEHFAALPSHTAEIHGPIRITGEYISRLSVSWTTLIPQSLKHLSANCPPLTPQDIEGFPRSLTSLSQISIGYTALSEVMRSEGTRAAQNLWPPALTSLILSVTNNVVDIKAEELVVLPRNLKVLKSLVIDADTKLFNHLSLLPTNLVDLDLVWYTRGSMIPMESELPSGLTSLRLSGAYIWPPNFSKLPRGLKVLSLPDTSIHEPKWSKYLPRLPPSIEKLRLGRFEVSGLSVLPPSLVKLTVIAIIGQLDDTTPIKLPPSLIRIKSLKPRPDSLTSKSRIFIFGNY